MAKKKYITTLTSSPGVDVTQELVEDQVRKLCRTLTSDEVMTFGYDPNGPDGWECLLCCASVPVVYIPPTRESSSIEWVFPRTEPVDLEHVPHTEECPVTRARAIIESGMMAAYRFLLDVLRLQREYECYGEPIYWVIDQNKDPSFTFYVLCNDLFWWATADAEKLTPEGLPLLRQAICDVQETDVYTSRLDAYETGCMLWCARTRKMRPQRPAYPMHSQLRALFDACGPERDPKDEG